jgi:hypothetical protein
MALFWIDRSGRVLLEVSVDEFLINFENQIPMTFLVDVNMKKGKVPISGHLWSQAAIFYKEGMQKLVPRCNKCLSNGGNYVGK